MEWRIHHDCDSRLRLRKLVIEASYRGKLLDRTRMCMFFRFRLAKRIARRKAKMLARANIMLAAVQA